MVSEEVSFITIQFPDSSSHTALHLPKCFDSRDKYGVDVAVLRPI